MDLDTVTNLVFLDLDGLFRRILDFIPVDTRNWFFRTTLKKIEVD